jgi:hypothetical protein
MEISNDMANQINKYLEQYEIDLRLTEENKPDWNELIKNIIRNLELRLTGPRMMYEFALKKLSTFKEILDGEFNHHICAEKIDELEKLFRIKALK